MTSRARVAFAVVVAAAALSPVPALAQSFGVRLERGEVGVDGRGRLQSQEQGPLNTSSNYQQWLRVPISGFLLHPRVIRYTFAVRPLFGQSLASSADQGTRSSSLGLDGSASFFQGRRLSVTLQGTQSSGRSSGDFSTETTFDNTDLTGILFVRSRYFPTTVTYSNRSIADRWESAFAALPIERDQRATRFRAETRNRKLTTIFEQTSYRELRGTSDHDATSAQARHRLTWGKGSSLVSVFNHYDRRGASAITRSSWSERLTILHTEAVSTGLAFARQGWSRETIEGRNLSYEAATRYMPSLDATASIAVSGQRFESETGGGLSRLRIAPSGRYAFDVGSVAISTSATVGTERLSRTLPSDALIDVIEEPHRIDASRVFALDQIRIEPESIEVWNESRTLILEREIDYRVIVTGPVVEIQVLPGGRVGEGETVLVNYRYRSLAAEDVGLLYVNYETSARYSGVTLRHGRRQRSRDVSGPSGALDDPNDVDLWFGVSLVRRTRLGALSVDLTRRTRDASEIDYTSDEVRLGLVLRPVGKITGRVRATTSSTNADGLNTRNSSAGVSVSWPASRSLRISGGLDGWVWERDEQEAETFLSANFMMTWQFGDVNAVIGLDQVRRANGTSLSESRWSVRLVRRF